MSRAGGVSARSSPRERFRAPSWRAGSSAPDSARRPLVLAQSATPDTDNLTKAARIAETHLRRTRPYASAAHGPTRIQTGFAGALAASLILFASVDPSAAAHAVSIIFAAALGALSLFRLAACATPPAPASSQSWPGALPVYTVIAALYREGDVLAELVDALSRLDYPRARLDIKLVLEADDAETIAAARALDLDERFEVILAPPGEPRTKPRALNIALAFARGEFVTVYDAEDRPSPNQLRAALNAFAAGGEKLACAQAPLGWYNARETWLTRQFALEYAIQFHVILPALARWGWALPLGGTSNHFRTRALKAVGGWDPHNVTEDADLGFRLATEGWRTGVIAPGTLEEATTTLAPWTRQRTRWIKGFMQTWLVHMRRPFALLGGGGPGAAAALHLTIGLSALSSLLHAPIAAGCLAAFLTGALSWQAAAMFVGGYAVAATAAILGARRAGLRLVLADIAAMPVYWTLHTRAAALAVIELVRRPHYWAKTTHGVSAMFQRARAAPPSALKPARAPRGDGVAISGQASRAEPGRAAPAGDSPTA